MPTLADVLTNTPVTLTAGRFTVADDSPLQVYLDGSTTAIDGDGVEGLTYTVGDTGYYFLIQGHRPLCLCTAGTAGP